MASQRDGNIFRPVILGAFGPPTLACLRSWGRQGWQPGLIAVQTIGERPPRSTYLGAACSLPREALFTAAGVKIIADFLESYEATGLMCIDEKITVWLNTHRLRFPSRLQWWIPPTATVNRVLSKIDQIETASKVGFDLLPTYYFTPGDALPSIPAGHFPLCLRPSQPNSTSPAFKVRNVDSRAEIEVFLNSLETVEDPLIGQPFTNLPNLVVHGARSVSGETFGMSGFLVARKFQGVTLTIRPYELTGEMERKCRAFTDDLGLVGNYHFEFLLDPATGRACFLEVNYRFGGTTAKVMACGYDEPAWAIQSFGVKAVVRLRVKPVTASSKQALVKSLLCALKNELTALDYPVESKLRRVLYSLYGLLVFRDDILCLDDLKGVFGFYLGNIKTKLQAGSRQVRRGKVAG
jgi:hypothetical protein